MIQMVLHFKQLKFYSAKLYLDHRIRLKILFYYIGNRRKIKNDYSIKATYIRRKYYAR